MNKQRFWERKFFIDDNGFSLAEVMVVLLLISIIVAFAIPSFQDAYNKNKQRDIRTQLIMLHGVNKTHVFKTGTYLIGTDLNKAQINAGLNMNIIAEDVIFDYDSDAGGTTYTVTADWNPPGVGNEFTLCLKDANLKYNTPNANPCCSAGTCYTEVLPGCGGACP